MNPKDTHRYKLNEYSHKLLDKLFSKVSPIFRHSEPTKNIQSELFSTHNFPDFSIDSLIKEIGISDEFMQNVCEYLSLHKHIEIRETFNKSVISKIRANESGYKAYKFETYLEKNETLDYQHKFKLSAFWNNVMTPVIAGLAFVISLFTFIKDSFEHNEQSVSQQQFNQQLQSIDSLRKVQTNALNQLLTKSVPYIKDTSQQKDTTH